MNTTVGLYRSKIGVLIMDIRKRRAVLVLVVAVLTLVMILLSHIPRVAEISTTHDILNEHVFVSVHVEESDTFCGEGSGHGQDSPVLPKFDHEVHHVGFLKVHKAASTTVQNMFYRFGLQRNLSFVLPTNGHYLSKRKHIYNEVLPPLPSMSYHSNDIANSSNTINERKPDKKYDIITNHCSFNVQKFKTFLPDDAVYIGIVRDPLELFISAAFYYKFVWKFPYLHKLNKDTFITDLIHYPRTHESNPLLGSQTFNSMAQDFGYEMDKINDVMRTSNAVINDFVTNIGCVFKFVMIVERFEESLVILRRFLNWPFKDILFLKSNVYKPGDDVITAGNLTAEDRRVFKRRNRIDYFLYDFFLKRFNEQIGREPNITEEVKHFHHALEVTSEFCTGASDAKPSRVQFSASHWNPMFEITTHDCDLMKTDELHIVEIMKKRHKQMLRARV